MTEHDPDDLYQALRDRLADYGQEPPAPLWASIRAQLPPPVAAPQLRKRRRSVAALLLGLLLIISAMAGWHWRHQAVLTPAGARGRPLLARTGTTSPNPNSVALVPAATASQAAGASQAEIIANQTATAQRFGKNRLEEPSSSTNKKIAPDSEASDSEASDLEASDPEVSDVAVASGTFSAQRVAAERRVGRGWAGIRSGRAAAGREFTFGEGRKSNPSKSTIIGDKAGLVSSATKNTTTLAAATETTAGETGLPASARSSLLTSTKTATTEALSAANAVTTGSLALRLAALELPALDALRQPLPADTLPQEPLAMVRRWAVQVAAGPALTYRYLNAEPQYNILNNTAVTSRTMDASTAGEESASYGFGVQVQGRRVLNGRWSLSGGLGYQEYAMKRTYLVSNPSVIFANPSQPTTNLAPTYSTGTHRDTYRFLTVPVRLSYALGQASRHLRYGLLGGADVALYLGGTSAGADGARHTWGISDSPHRSLGVALSAGFELRYRTAPRLELLAQPSATYFLNSLTQPASGITARQLLGVGALFGISYDLR